MNVPSTLQTASLSDACQSQVPLCCCEPHLLLAVPPAQLGRAALCSSQYLSALRVTSSSPLNGSSCLSSLFSACSLFCGFLSAYFSLGCSLPSWCAFNVCDYCCFHSLVIPQFPQTTAFRNPCGYPQLLQPLVAHGGFVGNTRTASCLSYIISR